jgi:hypothetical protein
VAKADDSTESEDEGGKSDGGGWTSELDSARECNKGDLKDVDVSDRVALEMKVASAKESREVEASRAMSAMTRTQRGWRLAWSAGTLSRAG